MLPVSREKYNAMVAERDLALARIQELLAAQVDSTEEIARALSDVERLQNELNKANTDSEANTARIAELEAEVASLRSEAGDETAVIKTKNEPGQVDSGKALFEKINAAGTMAEKLALYRASLKN
jgi:predicted  nucleic acid-binding Zn-ribbon protein